MLKFTSRLFRVLLAVSLPWCGSCSSYKSYNTLDAGSTLRSEVSDKQGLHYFLPRAKVVIEGKYKNILGADGKTTVRRVYEVVVQKANFPDGNAPMFLEMTENGMYDEDTVIDVKNGLLSTATAKPTDQTSQIVLTVVGMAIDAAKIAARGGAGGLESLEAPVATLKPVTEFAVTVDPFDPESVETARREIGEAGFIFTSSVPSLRQAGGAEDAELRHALATLQQKNYKVTKQWGRSRGPATPKDVRSGIGFRRPTSHTVSLKKKADYDYIKVDVPVSGATQYAGGVIVPDAASAPSYLPSQRGFMTKRETIVTFENGEPTKLDLKAPSPVLGFVKLPAGIVKMVGEAIPSVIQVKHDTAKSEITRQTELLEAQKKLMDAQAALDKLKAAQ